MKYHIILIGWFVLFLTTNAYSDTILFKNGTRLDVENTWEENDQVKVNLYGTIVSYSKKEILRVDKKNVEKDISIKGKIDSDDSFQTGNEKGTKAFDYSSPKISSSAHPKTFCDLTKDLGYPTRGYNPNTDGCASNMTEVTSTPGRNGLTNNLAFYSMGKFDNPQKLMRVSLILNVNNTSEKAKAHDELARVAGVVAIKILGAEPQGLQIAIRQEMSNNWVLGEWTVQVKYSVWPTDLGHDISVYFRPSDSR